MCDSYFIQATGDKLVVLQGTNNANGGIVTGRTGVAVWNSCLLLTRLLDLMGKNNKMFLQDKTVLELGKKCVYLFRTS